jgi:hypothetical protein
MRGARPAALVRWQAVEGPLDREDRVDAAHRFERQRREVDRVALGASTRAVSASSKNLRRPWLQQAASVTAPGLRLAT